MKLVYISNSIIPSRTANSIHVMKMCQAFSDNGHDVVLLAPLHKNNINDINLFDYYGVKNCFEIKFIPYFNIKKLWSFSYAYNVNKYIKTIEVDSVYGRDLKSCFLSTYIKKEFLVTYEPHKPYEKHNIIDKIVLKRIVRRSDFKQLVVISNALKKMYLALPKFKNINIQVAHDGADKPKDSSVIQSITKTQQINVGYTGHLYKGRGIDIILGIAKELENVNFHIVGGQQNDIDFWKSQSSLPNVYFHGFVEPSEVYKYVNSFDIILAPYQNKVSIAGKDDTSKYMSPLKIFEYMASKKPIIVSDLKVLHEVLDKNEAIFVTYDNIKEWTNAVLKLESNSMRENLSQASYTKFINKFTWHQRAKNVI